MVGARSPGRSVGTPFHPLPVEQFESKRSLWIDPDEDPNQLVEKFIDLDKRLGRFDVAEVHHLAQVAGRRNSDHRGCRK